MSVTQERKAELITQFKKSDKDTGSADVQVAVLTERIRNLTEHMKAHKKDFHTRHGLLKMVGKRQSLLKYIKSRSTERYADLIKSLGLRR